MDDLNRVLYPGTFDPITLGHQDLIDRALKLFGKVVVAIAASEAKKPMFSLDERIELVRQLYQGEENLEVVGYRRELTVNLMRRLQCMSQVRGVRATGDFEYEMQLVNMNRAMSDDLETIFLLPRECYAFISSTLVKEIATLDGDVTQFVSPLVNTALLEKLEQKARS